MNINEYIEKHGSKKTKKLFINAGSKPSLITHIKRGVRKPSLLLISRLVIESNREITFRGMIPNAIYEAIRHEVLNEFSTKSENEKIEVNDNKETLTNAAP